MSMPSTTPRILLLGASGYIGGTVLHYLLQSPNPALRNAPISVLIRGEARAQKLKEAYGDRVQPIVFAGLDDTKHVAAVASEHDIVVGAGLGYHTPGSTALVQGLAARLTEQQQEQPSDGAPPARPWIIHLSGVTNISDSPPLGDDHPERRFDDADPLSIYEHMKREEAKMPYPQRTTELTVLDAAADAGVRAVAVQAPAIFGPGRGLFAAGPTVLPMMYQFVLEKGYSFQLGDGTACIGVAHVDDVAAFFVLLTEKILDNGGEDLPSGRNGILYSQAGIIPTVDAARGCLAAAFRRGLLPKPDGPQKKEIRVVDLDEVAPYTGGGHVGKIIASKAWSGHMNTIGTVAERLGWKPVHAAEEWTADSHYDEELTAMLEGKRDVHVADSVAAALKK